MNPAPRGMPSPSLASKPVVIVGGGLSGLAAAVELASRKIPVVLLEQKPRLGGRAYSFVDETTGDVVDNGQHVLIAGYDRTMAFLDRIGTKHLLNIQEAPSLVLHHPTRGFCAFRLPKLPAPFHLLAGVLLTDLFPVKEKITLLRSALIIRSENDLSRFDAMSVGECLGVLGQSGEMKRSFWEPLAISIMNEHIANASAKIFLHSFRQAFIAGWKNAALAIPRVGLSELYVNDAVAFIKNHGGDVRMNADVAGLVLTDGKVSAVRCRDGSSDQCSSLILAVPHYRADALLPVSVKSQLPAIAGVPSTPIVSIHLWFERDFMQHDFVGLIERRVQWVFNKRKIERRTAKGGHISCVISAANEFVEKSNEELVAIALEDLRSAYRNVPAAILHSVVIREKRATFSCTPEVDKFRPHHHTSIPNLFLSGDWTDTGLPATIEGAIRSGEECAKLAATVSS